jgi:hypothetical protein
MQRHFPGYSVLRTNDGFTGSLAPQTFFYFTEGENQLVGLKGSVVIQYMSYAFLIRNLEVQNGADSIKA